MLTAFTILITLQFIVIACHDLVELPGWTHTSQMQAVLGKRKLWGMTLANSTLPGLAMVFAFYFWHAPKPAFVRSYWLVYCAITVASAVAMWYVPYFVGADQKNKDEYRQFYSGTRQILPPRGDNPRPNLMHMLFHVLFLVTLSLAIAIQLHRA